MDANDITAIRSEAILEFCEKAELLPSVQVRGLPDDVRRYRMQAAFAARAQQREG